MIEQNLSFCNLDSFDLNNILVGVQLYVITQTDDRNHCTKFQRNLASDHNNTV